MSPHCFDELDIPGKPADTMIIALHDFGDRTALALCLLDVDTREWLLHFADVEGVKEIIASLQQHLVSLEEANAKHS